MRLILCICVLLLVGCTESTGPQLKSIHGERIVLHDYLGKWVFINYWAEWCTPCHEEIAEFNAFYRQHKQVVVLGVNYDHLPDQQLIKLTQRMGIHFPVLSGDPDQQLGIRTVAQLPTTYVISPQGKLHSMLIGPQTQKQLIAIIE